MVGSFAEIPQMSVEALSNFHFLWDSLQNL